MTMESLIPIASKLQDVLGAIGQTQNLDLPQIVVVGGQSSGKSSVLESLVGRSFLPRGNGIVTRRPLILQLYNTANDENHNGEEFGEFLHLPNHRFTDFRAIRQEIVAETDRLTGMRKGIDATPIHLKIYSPKVLALTVVDLPGIAKVPVGDQPENIEQQIQAMCAEFISNPNAIILAVTAANQDLANSDALKLAQAADPSGNRTVGVLTKVDLMDPGTDCSEILMNQVIPLRRGYIAVVNRGQKDVKSDVSIRDGLKKEEHFFRNHPVYSREKNLISKCGTTKLAKALNNMLMHHIRDCLPDLKHRIGRMMGDVQSELEALGTNNIGNRSARGASLLGLLSKFTTNFAAILDGKGRPDGKTLALPVNELMGGARISFIFTEVFGNSLNSVGAFDGLTDEEIRTTIANANGTRPALFVPEVSFDILVRRQVARLEEPGVNCVDLIYEELQRIATQSEPSELTRFPVLRERMSEVVMNLLRRCVGPTQMMVSNVVKIELAYVNTSHPDFIGGSAAVAGLMQKSAKEDRAAEIAGAVEVVDTVGTAPTPLSPTSQDDEQEDEGQAVAPPAGGGIMGMLFNNNNSNVSRKKKDRKSIEPPSIVTLPQVPDRMKQTDVPPSEKERIEMEIIKSLVESYFGIIRKNFIDFVPKTIMYFLVNHVRDSLQNELVSELYREAEVGTLMQEAEDIAQRRQTCIEMKELLGKALDIVNEVRDYRDYE
mmetsp:Transcript_24788/g.68601  ORF Transcript_24788/g.68601 Transcript_24788/m.68601 type:complete len:717 (+) Transcript_24788:56-2206(+)